MNKVTHTHTELLEYRLLMIQKIRLLPQSLASDHRNPHIGTRGKSDFDKLSCTAHAHKNEADTYKHTEMSK